MSKNMKNLEILCATMHQKDFSKIKEMNIQSDVVFANQAGKHSYEEIAFDGYKAKMITTAQRGVGKNRNTALLYAKGDICLFADDDVRYVDGYSAKIIDAFDALQDADAIVFNLTTDSDRELKRNLSIKKVKKWRFFGACRIAVRLDSVTKANVWFHQSFGGGCRYSAGEDSLWLLEARKKGLKIYTHPLVIGEVEVGNSTWFKGFDEKFFFDKGAFVQAAFPKVKYFAYVYFIVVLWRKTEISRMSMIRAMISGSKAFIKNYDYAYWRNNING